MIKPLYASLAFIAILSLFSCEKIVPEPEPEPTTYTVKMQLSTATPTASVKVDLTAFEYNEAGEKIATNSMDEVTVGYSKTFTANSRSVKIKLYVKMYSNLSTSTRTRWVQQVFYLEPEKNIDVILKDDTMLGSDEP